MKLTILARMIKTCKLAHYMSRFGTGSNLPNFHPGSNLQSSVPIRTYAADPMKSSFGRSGYIHPSYILDLWAMPPGH